MPSCVHRSDGAGDCWPSLGCPEEGGRGCGGGRGPSWAMGVHGAGVTARLCQCSGPGEGQNRGETPAAHTPLVPCERPPGMGWDHHGGLTSGGRSNAWGSRAGGDRAALLNWPQGSWGPRGAPLPALGLQCLPSQPSSRDLLDPHGSRVRLWTAHGGTQFNTEKSLTLMSPFLSVISREALNTQYLLRRKEKCVLT